MLFGHAHEAMKASDAVLVASGTATLEAALLKRPMAIVYKMASFSFRMMRRMGYLPYVGLPNILAGKSVVPEFIQDDATAENLGPSAAQLLFRQKNLRFDRRSLSRYPPATEAEHRRKGGERDHRLPASIGPS